MGRNAYKVITSAWKAGRYTASDISPAIIRRTGFFGGDKVGWGEPQYGHGSRFQVHGSQLKKKLIQVFQPRTLNRERRTLIPYVVYDFRSIINAAELLPKIEPGRKKGPTIENVRPLSEGGEVCSVQKLAMSIYESISMMFSALNLSLLYCKKPH